MKVSREFALYAPIIRELVEYVSHQNKLAKKKEDKIQETEEPT